jgi:lipopolysaccharide export system ATP-binding protein
MKLFALAIFGLAITAFAQNQVVTATAQSSKSAKSPNPKATESAAAKSPFENESKGPITTEIYADEASFDSGKNMGIFTGHVKVFDPRFNLQSDKLTVYLRKGEDQGLEKAIAEGNVGLVRDRPDPNGGPPTHAVGRSEHAVYMATDGSVELTGMPKVQQGPNMHIATRRTPRHSWPKPNGDSPGTEGRKTRVTRGDGIAIAQAMISTTAAPSSAGAKATVPPNVLSTRELVKIYGGRAVVNGINVNVKAGEIVGLLGPNGAGKTTTFYMIVGLVRPHSGSVIFRDQDVTTFPMYKRARFGMGYLPQEESIFRKMTVEQNIMAILETLPLSKHERRQRCDHLLHQFGIEKIAKNTALTLSGGEKRRLTIARSLVTSPSLLMLDEPFSGVDPIAVYDVQQIVVKLRKSGLAILITDHNVRETLSIVDRAYLIYEGRVESEGSKDFLINDPISRQLYLGERFRM